MEVQKPNYSGFVVIGAGLPRTGTLSTRAALNHLLEGACYHMADVMNGGKDVSEFWSKALAGNATKTDWVQHLAGKGYRSGVDYPISIFYR